MLSRRSELKRTELVRKSPLVGGGGLSRGSTNPADPLLRSRARRNSRQLPPVGPDVRAELMERQDGRCPHCDRPMLALAAHVHHRKKRSQGGDNHIDNLLLLPGTCHQDVHANVERSYELGHMVRRGDNPSDVRIRPITRDWVMWS